MASLIVFDRNGKASWVPMKSGEQILHKIPRAIVEFTDSDKAWFRKPITEK